MFRDRISRPRVLNASLRMRFGIYNAEHGRVRAQSSIFAGRVEPTLGGVQPASAQGELERGRILFEASHASPTSL